MTDVEIAAELARQCDAESIKHFKGELWCTMYPVTLSNGKLYTVTVETKIPERYRK